jgi:hypothetical protein
MVAVWDRWGAFPYLPEVISEGGAESSSAKATEAGLEPGLVTGLSVTQGTQVWC